MSSAPGREVILVHGLWYGPWTLRRLTRSLEQRDFQTRHFRYAATAASLESHAADLGAFARESDSAELHFLGHSLGGLVILRMLAESGDIAPGRVLLLGTPLRGSVIARKMRGVPGSGRLLGRVRHSLEAGFTGLPADRDTGMIAGSHNFGLGLFTGGVGGPGDGTVALRETEAEGLKDRLVLPVSHSGMLFSTMVARQAVSFIETGSFSGIP
jgi:pimeloyl-ACP methyl ester carboxylesterase